MKISPTESAHSLLNQFFAKKTDKLYFIKLDSIVEEKLFFRRKSKTVRLSIYYRKSNYVILEIDLTFIVSYNHNNSNIEMEDSEILKIKTKILRFLCIAQNSIEEQGMLDYVCSMTLLKPDIKIKETKLKELFN